MSRRRPVQVLEGAGQENPGAICVSPGSPVLGRSGPADSSPWFVAQQRHQEDPVFPFDHTSLLDEGAPVQVYHEGEWYPSAYHARLSSQATFYNSIELQRLVRQISDPAKLAAPFEAALLEAIVSSQIPGWAERGFSAYSWDQQLLSVVQTISDAKFIYNSEARSVLLSTGDRYLVCARQDDLYFGSGMRQDHSQMQSGPDSLHFRGKNHLGHILMRLRRLLQPSGPISPAAALPSEGCGFDAIFERLTRG